MTTMIASQLHIAIAAAKLSVLCREIGQCFHPDTPVSDYQDATHNPLFDEEDAAALQSELNGWQDTLRAAGIDPCEVLLAVMEPPTGWETVEV